MLQPLDANKALTEMASDERARLCEQTFKALGSSSAPRDCGSFTVTPLTIGRCAEQTYRGECTVGTAQACNEGVAGDPCKHPDVQSCVELAGCTR